MTFHDGGKALAIGKAGEERVFSWLSECQRRGLLRGIIDMREFRIAQRLDADCGIETIDSALVMGEIKTDTNLSKTPNFLFEMFRINYHLSPDEVFYLGWVFRSPAKYLLYYSPEEDRVYRFRFSEVRGAIARFAQDVGKDLMRYLNVTLTDDHRLTVNILLPKRHLDGKYDVFNVYDVLPPVAPREGCLPCPSR